MIWKYCADLPSREFCQQLGGEQRSGKGEGAQWKDHHGDVGEAGSLGVETGVGVPVQDSEWV